jgi:hypothetical protein
MKRFVDLEHDYALDSALDKARTLTQAGLTLATAQAKYPKWYARWKAKGLKAGWTQAKIDQTFMLNGTFTAAANDAFFSRQAHSLADATGSSCNVIVPWGEYRTSAYIYAAIGKFNGDGTFAHGGDMGSTVIIPWHDNWNPEPGFVRGQDRLSLGTAVIGTGGILGYQESSRIESLRFEGDKRDAWHDPSYVSSGLILAGAGEGFIVDNILANNHNNYGIEITQGTPCTLRYASVFNNCLGGIAMINSALATIKLGVVSGDDNPYLMVMVGGATGEPGGMVDIDLVKLETDTSPGGIWADKDQIVGYWRGQFGVNIGAISAASGNSKSNTLFLVDCRLNNGTKQSSRMNVGMVKNINVENLVIDLANQKRWPAPPSYVNYSFTYDSDGGGVVKVDGNEITPIPYTHNDRMGVATGQQQYDYNNYTPRWSPEGPAGPPPPTEATWITGPWSEWSECVNGRQSRTRTVTSSIPGQIPTGTKPTGIEAQDCVVTPPPSGAVIASFNFSQVSAASITAQTGSAMKQTDGARRVSSMAGGKITNTNSVASYPVVWDGATSITLKFKPSTLNYQLLCGLTDTDGNGRGIMFLPNGSVIDNTLAGGDRELKPAGTFQVGREDTVTINFGAMNIRFFGSNGAQGNAWQGVMDELEVK